jgi:hypothetical protein
MHTIVRAELLGHMCKGEFTFDYLTTSTPGGAPNSFGKWGWDAGF